MKNYRWEVDMGHCEFIKNCVSVSVQGLKDYVDKHINMFDNKFLHALACDLLNYSNELASIGYKLFLKMR